MEKGENVGLSLEIVDGELWILQIHIVAINLPHHLHSIGMSVGPRQIALAQPIAVKWHFKSSIYY